MLVSRRTPLPCFRSYSNAPRKPLPLISLAIMLLPQDGTLYRKEILFDARQEGQGESLYPALIRCPCKLVEIGSHAGQFRVDSPVDLWNRGRGKAAGKRSDTQPASRRHAHEGGFPLQTSPFLTVDPDAYREPPYSVRGTLGPATSFPLALFHHAFPFLPRRASRLSEAKTWLAASPS